MSYGQKMMGKNGVGKTSVAPFTVGVGASKTAQFAIWMGSPQTLHALNNIAKVTNLAGAEGMLAYLVTARSPAENPVLINAANMQVGTVIWTTEKDGTPLLPSMSLNKFEQAHRAALEEYEDFVDNLTGITYQATAKQRFQWYELHAKWVASNIDYMKRQMFPMAAAVAALVNSGAPRADRERLKGLANDFAQKLKIMADTLVSWREQAEVQARSWREQETFDWVALVAPVLNLIDKDKNWTLALYEVFAQIKAIIEGIGDFARNIGEAANNIAEAAKKGSDLARKAADWSLWLLGGAAVLLVASVAKSR